MKIKGIALNSSTLFFYELFVQFLGSFIEFIRHLFGSFIFLFYSTI